MLQTSWKTASISPSSSGHFGWLSLEYYKYAVKIIHLKPGQRLAIVSDKPHDDAVYNEENRHGYVPEGYSEWFPILVTRIAKKYLFKDYQVFLIILLMTLFQFCQNNSLGYICKIAEILHSWKC